MPVHRETHTIDGIDYDVRVVQAEGSLWGEWTCGYCGQRGKSSQQCRSLEDAVMSAKMNLGTQHGMDHKSKEDLPE